MRHDNTVSKLNKKPLLIILFLSFIIKIPFFFLNTFPGTAIGTDSVAYMRLSENYIKNGNYSFGENFNYGLLFPPGYPISIGVVNLFCKDLFTSGKIVSLLFSSLTIFMCYLLGRRLYDELAGNIAAIMFSIYPGIFYSSILIGSEAQFFFFLLVGFLIITKFNEKQNSFISVSLGLSAALLYLTRPEGIIMSILPLLLMLKMKLKPKIKIIYGGIILASFLIISGPYILFLSKNIGGITFSGKSNFNFISGLDVINGNYVHMRYGLNSNKDQINIYDQMKTFSIYKYLRNHPKSFIKKYFINVKKLSENIVVFGFPFIVLVIFGIMRNDRLKFQVNQTILSFSLILFFAFPLYFIQRRYVYPIIIPIIIIASGIISTNIVKIKTKIKKIAVILFIAYSILLNIKIYPINRDKIPTDYIYIGKYLKKNFNIGVETNIMSRKPWVSFYSGSRWTDLPYASFEEILLFAEKYSVDYIVFNEKTIGNCEGLEKFQNSSRAKNSFVEIILPNSINKIFVLKYPKNYLSK